MYVLNDVRETEIQTAELLLFKLNVFEVEMATEKPKTQKSSYCSNSRRND